MGNFFILLVCIFGFLWFSSTEQGERLLEPVLGKNLLEDLQGAYSSVGEIIESFGKNGFNSQETDIAKYECSDVVDLVKDMKPQNTFGATFKILSIKNVRLVSKDAEKIICSGIVHLSDDTKTRYNMTVEQTDDGILYGLAQP